MRLRELVLAYRLCPGPITIDSKTSLTTPQDGAALLARLLSEEAVEVFGILCLNTKHQVLAWHEVSRGCLDATLVNPREVFKAAILANAAALIVAHNHPSGDPTPSPDDRKLTERLVAAGSLLGIEVVDHIVVGHEGRYCSFQETGLL